MLFTRGDVRFEEGGAGIGIVLHYVGGTFEFLPQDSDAILVDHPPQVVGGVEGILDADQMPVIADPSCPVFRLLAAAK